MSLIKIFNNQSLGQVEDDANQSKQYSFDLLIDLTPQRNSDGKNLLGYRIMSSPLQSANCGVMLQVNETYLIGGRFHHHTNEPFLFSCHSYIEKWDFSNGERSQEKLNLYMQECDSFDKQIKQPLAQSN